MSDEYHLFSLVELVFVKFEHLTYIGEGKYVILNYCLVLIFELFTESIFLFSLENTQNFQPFGVFKLS